MQLPNIGIGQQFIAFTNVTMESDKFICVRETGATNSVVIVDMANPLAPQKRPITADSALMNPVSKVLALKAAVQPGPGDNLQIFNLDMKAKMKSFAMTEPVVFWKWISAAKLGLVTATSVYHWDMNVSPCCSCPRLHIAANTFLNLNSWHVKKGHHWAPAPLQTAVIPLVSQAIWISRPARACIWQFH